MDFINKIENYMPKCAQEESDKLLTLRYCRENANILERSNTTAHVTSSGFIVNQNFDKILFVHHNIRNTWTWSGGHADGDSDLLLVAIKEAQEETGLKTVKPLSKEIASIDIFPVYGHMKNGAYVSAHLHLSIAYLLVADDSEELVISPDENSAVMWVDERFINRNHFDETDFSLYSKLLERAREINEGVKRGV